MIYLPGLSQRAANSASRVAELMAIKLNNESGKFSTEDRKSPSARLSNGQRIIGPASDPVLDLYMLDYRPHLREAKVNGTGAAGALRRFALALLYFLRALVLFLNVGSSRNSKNPIAKFQVLLGSGIILTLMASVVFTALAVLVSVGLWKDPVIAGNAADAIALGATATTTWILLRVRPTILAAAAQIECILDYAQDERRAAGVASGLGAVLDDLLEAEPDRKIYIFGYSFGALVAVDFLYPRKSLHPTTDSRYGNAISKLVTVGCPIDFIRLYIPNYPGDRLARVKNLFWTNVYIPADVLGSNLANSEETPANGKVTIVDARIQSFGYTEEKLGIRNIWTGTGFFSHSWYWDEADHENCLHLVINAVLPAYQRPIDPAGNSTESAPNLSVTART